MADFDAVDELKDIHSHQHLRTDDEDIAEGNARGWGVGSIEFCISIYTSSR